MKGKFDTREQLDSYERLWHAQIYQPSWLELKEAVCALFKVLVVCLIEIKTACSFQRCVLLKYIRHFCFSVAIMQSINVLIIPCFVGTINALQMAKVECLPVIIYHTILLKVWCGKCFILTIHSLPTIA